MTAFVHVKYVFVCFFDIPFSVPFTLIAGLLFASQSVLFISLFVGSHEESADVGNTHYLFSVRALTCEKKDLLWGWLFKGENVGCQGQR